MTEISRPWQSTSPGDAGPYSAQQWQVLYQNIIGLGVMRPNVGPMLGSGTQPNDGLKVQAKSVPTTSIDVLAGSALVQGAAYINTATVSFVIAANGSGNPRIDTVILRADYALQTVRLAVLQGTPAASPANPTLTQSANTLWEIPLADIAVANGFTSITNANITPRHEWANAANGVYLDGILNNSGVTLQDGDVVIWDATTDRAVITTTTFDDPLLAGVWRGRTAAAGYGRVQVLGIGTVNADAAVTRGDTLVTSATTKKAAVNTNIVGAVLGMALETISGTGFVLTRINTRRLYVNQGFQPFAAPIGYSAANTYTTAIALAAISGTILIPIQLAGPMLLQSVQVLNNDTATQRTWRWDLYQDIYDNANTIPRMATSNGSETFTPGGVGSVRTLAASGAPVKLLPGSYYLAIQNVHATSTFGVGAQAVGGVFNPIQVKTKTTGGVNGATLDIIAATWATSGAPIAVNLRGRAAGDTVAW